LSFLGPTLQQFRILIFLLINLFQLLIIAKILRNLQIII
jgi:hypothetical protein